MGQWFCYRRNSRSVSYGVVKMNIDTDTQWAFWMAIHKYYLKYKDYLQGK
jgi:fructose-bisphosphate aldolase class II